ncbi:hypothetical protein [Pedobacter sp. UYP24]
MLVVIETASNIQLVIHQDGVNRIYTAEGMEASTESLEDINFSFLIRIMALLLPFHLKPLKNIPMKKIATLLTMCLISIMSLSSFVTAKTAVMARCQATYTVVFVDGSGNVVDRATMHGYGNTCAEAMADAQWRMAPVAQWMAAN